MDDCTRSAPRASRPGLRIARIPPLFVHDLSPERGTLLFDVTEKLA